MSTDQWTKLTEVYGQLEADNYKSMLEAYGITTKLFQESVGKNFGFPMNVGKFALVQVYVQTSDLPLANELLEEIKDQNTKGSN
jgi:hypothetical protein